MSDHKVGKEGEHTLGDGNGDSLRLGVVPVKVEALDHFEEEVFEEVSIKDIKWEIRRA